MERTKNKNQSGDWRDRVKDGYKGGSVSPEKPTRRPRGPEPLPPPSGNAVLQPAGGAVASKTVGPFKNKR